MKPNRKQILSLAVALCFCGAVAAYGAEETATERPLSQQELAALEQFLSLSDEQLDRIQAAVARVRAMSIEERKAYAEEIVRYRSLPREERAQIREGWGWQSAGDREDWRAMMQALTPEERRELHEAMHRLPHGERTEYRLKVLEKWRGES
jgi:hypothetical protein